MTFRKRTPLNDRILLESLAKGMKPREIAAKNGETYPAIRKQIARYVQTIGCATPEEAVAKYTAEKIKRALPLAIQKLVDDSMK